MFPNTPIKIFSLPSSYIMYPGDIAAHILQYKNYDSGSPINFTKEHLAWYFNIDSETINKWRHAKKMPPRIKGRNAYAGPDIAQWLLDIPNYRDQKTHKTFFDFPRLVATRASLLSTALAEAEKDFENLRSAIKENYHYVQNNRRPAPLHDARPNGLARREDK